MSVRDKIAKTVMDRIRAWHASPHDFNKFESRPYTGEGAQVYGHGTYAAESPKVSGPGGEYWRQFLDDRFEGSNDYDLALLLEKHGFDRAKAAAAMRRQIEVNEKHLADQFNLHDANPYMRPSLEGTAAALRMRRRELAQIESGAQIGPRAYEIDIHGRPEQFLHLDKPIAAQSDYVIDRVMPLLEKQRAIQETARRTRLLRGTDAFGKPLNTAQRDELLRPLKPIEETMGDKAYQNVGLPAANRYGGAEQASERLNAVGIPGLRYLDAGSRTLTPARAAIEPPTHNYVVFDPEKIDIVRKLALPGIIGAGAATQGDYDNPFGQNNYGVSP